jgi:hypothetical protein
MIVNSGRKEASATNENQEPWSSTSSGKTAPATVDVWFDAQLSQLYGEVLKEPIPEDLLSLVKKLNPSR